MSTTQPIRDEEKLEKFKTYYRTIQSNRRNYLLIIMGLNTALRISDLLSLRQEDVYDFNMRKIRTHVELREHKTMKVTRIYLNAAVKRALTECVRFSKGEYCLFYSGYTYTTPLSRSQAYRIVKRAADYAGLDDEHISCHSLRKTFGYYAWKHGVQPAMLMSIYNHSSYNITKRYLGISQDDKDAVFRKVRV